MQARNAQTLTELDNRCAAACCVLPPWQRSQRGVAGWLMRSPTSGRRRSVKRYSPRRRSLSSLATRRVRRVPCGPWLRGADRAALCLRTGCRGGGIRRDGDQGAGAASACALGRVLTELRRCRRLRLARRWTWCSASCACTSCLATFRESSATSARRVAREARLHAAAPDFWPAAPACS